MAFDLESAYKDGKTPKEVADFLASEYKFDADAARKDGKTDAEIATYLAGVTKPEEPLAERPSRFDPKVSTFDYHADKFKKGLAGFLSLGSLPAEALNLPGSVLSRVVGQPVGLPPAQIMSDTRGRIERGFGVRDLAPPSKFQEITGSIAEFAGGGIVPSAGVIAAAPRKIAAAVPEVLSTITGGTGAQLGADVAGSPGQLAGGVAGGVAGAAGSATVLGKLAPWLEGKFSHYSNKDRLAGKELEQAMQSEPNAGLNLSQSDDTARKIEGIGLGQFEPRLSQRTGADGIAVIESRVLGSKAERVGDALASERTNLETIDRAVERTMGPGGGKQVKSAATRVLQQATQRLDSQIDGVLEQERVLAKSLPADRSKGVGERLIALRAHAKAIADDVVAGQKKIMYETAAKTGAKDDTSDIVDVVRQIGGSDENIAQTMPPVFGDLIRKFKSQPGSAGPQLVDASGTPIRGSQAQRSGRDATFEELHSFYKQVNDEYYSAKHLGDSKEMRYLGQLKDVLGEKMRKFGSKEYGELADQFNAFNKFYREKYIPAFVEGTGGRIGATNRFGEIVKPEDIAARYFTPSGVDDFRATFTNPNDGKIYPAAYEAFQDGVLTLFERHVVNRGTGTIDPKKVVAFISGENGETLKQLPELRKILLDVGARQEALVARNARAQAAKSVLGESHLAKLAGADDIEAYVAKAVSDPKELRRIMALPSTGAQQAALHAFADNLTVISSRYGVDPFTYITQNEGTLKPIFDKMGPNHFDNIKTIASAKTIMARGEPPGVAASTGGRMDPTAEAIGTTRLSALNMMKQAFITKSAQPEYVGAAMLARYMLKRRNTATDEALYAAIKDPETATRLMRAANNPESQVATNALTNHLVSIGVRASIKSPQEREENR